MFREELATLSRAEQRQVELHKYFLSQKRGGDVGFETAARDWFEKHSQEWREERHRRMLAMQRDEIARYKWLRSEEACRDLGAAAALEWIRLYAASWREWFEKEFNDVDELPGTPRR
jgi:hypothetical protein